MGGLAMALHACYHSKNFLDAISHGLNLLGDADSIGSICGQIAGAFYGYSGIQATAQVLIDDMNTHCDSDICYRAALLFHVAKDQKFAVPAHPIQSESKVSSPKKSSKGAMTVLWVLAAVLAIGALVGMLWYCMKRSGAAPTPAV